MARGAATALVLALTAVSGSCGGRASRPGPVNLVFISLDTVRRDHLPTYGYARDTAPAIDRLAGRSAVFTEAISQETLTNPSHTSMLTGLYPHTHGNLTNEAVLPRRRTTLAEVLQDAGFATGAFVSGYPLFRARCGLEQGFEVYDDAVVIGRRRGVETLRRAREWLEKIPAGKRFFLFLHLYDSHGPYEADPDYLKRFHSPAPGPLLENVPAYQQLRDEHGRPARDLGTYVDHYDATIRYDDDLVATLLGDLDLERTVVLVTADHGETLDERACVLDHGGEVFDEQVRIPLIVHVPGLEPRRVPQPVETVDFLPSLLDTLGVSVPGYLEFEGRSFAPLLRGEEVPWRTFTFSSSSTLPACYSARGLSVDPEGRIDAVRTEEWKLVDYPGTAREVFELYSLVDDPGETHDVAGDHPDVVSEYRRALAAWKSSAQPPAPQASKRDEDMLRSLGYVGR